MLRVEINKARPGMVLALPVFHPRQPSHMLLKMNCALEGSMIESMTERGVRSLWIRYPKLAMLEKITSLEMVRVQGRLVQQVSEVFEATQEQSAAKLPYTLYCDCVQGMIDQLVGNPAAAVFLGDLSEAGGPGMVRHSATVTYLSLLMGLKLESYMVRERRHVDPARAKEVVSLGLGAMLHDVGVGQLAEEVRERYFATGDESDPAWREHPTLGFQMVRGSIEPSAATVVLNHHQRYDGGGYAGAGIPPLEGHRIHVFARIVGAAEQFDRLRFPVVPAGPDAKPQTNAGPKPPKPDAPAVPAVAALRRMLEPDMAAKFDPVVLRALLTVAPPYPPGSVLRLSDGRFAAGVDHHPADPCRPTVQIIPDPAAADAADTPDEVINLSESPDGPHVVECAGQDVSAMNFPPPELMQDDAPASWA